MTAAKPAEFRTTLLMALGFGLVGIDRFLIAPLTPAIKADLQLNYTDIGTIASALAGAWALAALFMGNLADRIGRRKVLTGALVLFALLIGASGLATGLLGLVAVRIVMGVADGAYTPPSIAATLEASAPQRRGLNIGIQQMMLPLCGLTFAPLIVGLLLPHMSWRYVFVVFAAPGLLLAWAVWRWMPAPSPTIEAAPAPDRASDWRAVLAHRNIRLLMSLMLCWLTCLMTTAALFPSYLTDFLHLSVPQMGGVMAAVGIGSTIGTLALPALSDVIGRKPVMLASILGSAAALWMLIHTGAAPASLFVWLGAVHCCNNACITLTVGPLCSETVPARLTATATGVIIACGEVGGGFIAPFVAGVVADRYGIGHLLWLPLGVLPLAFILALFLKETRSKGAPHGE